MHVSVLYDEAMAWLQPRPGERYIDGTVGGGAGHATGILELSSPTGRLLALDADPEAIAQAGERLAPYSDRVTLVQANFTHLREIAEQYAFVPVMGILLDLGVSSLQLIKPERGFSFQYDGPLDMRFDQKQEVTARDLVNQLSADELADLLWRYGEERFSRQIARAIVTERPIESTSQLARLVRRIVRSRGRIDPATRTFQALRIAVNRELDSLREVLPQAGAILAPTGRLAVIAFHSLEDRLVKQFMLMESRDCLCPPGMPVCTCGHRSSLKILTRKPVKPTPEEIERNPRSRSARLRVAEKLPPPEGRRSRQTSGQRIQFQ